MASRALSCSRSVAAMTRQASPRGIATSTAPRMKAHAAEVSDFIDEPTRRRRVKAEFVPVCVALGMIALSTSLGLHAAKQQLLYSPNVFVSKKRRETIPEVEDPEWASAETDRYISRSLFRRVAHLQDFDREHAGISDPLLRGSRLYHPRRVEDLRTVGVDPHGH